MDVLLTNIPKGVTIKYQVNVVKRPYLLGQMGYTTGDPSVSAVHVVKEILASQLPDEVKFKRIRDQVTRLYPYAADLAQFEYPAVIRRIREAMDTMRQPIQTVAVICYKT